MNYLLARVKNCKSGLDYRIILSDRSIYNCNLDSIVSIPYDPTSLLDDGELYRIESFSCMDFCGSLIKEQYSSIDFDKLQIKEYDNIDFIISVQDGLFCYQNVSRSNLKPKKIINFGDSYEYVENGRIINVNSFPDAVYDKNTDTLYFHNLSKITGIFKGIGELYREATDEETNEFLNQSFINLDGGYSSTSVKTANRKRIALALDTLKQFNISDKKKVFKYIRSYCPKLKSKNDVFTIGSEEELKLLLFGIEQRFYTTIVGGERRIANSIITII